MLGNILFFDPKITCLFKINYYYLFWNGGSTNCHLNYTVYSLIAFFYVGTFFLVNVDAVFGAAQTKMSKKNM